MYTGSNQHTNSLLTVRNGTKECDSARPARHTACEPATAREHAREARVRVVALAGANTQPQTYHIDMDMNGQRALDQD